jgi:hypothetical protein
VVTPKISGITTSAHATDQVVAIGTTAPVRADS